MKRLRLWLLPILVGFGGCASVNHCNYVLRITSVEGARIEVGGSLYLSPFLAWRDTQYGEPPIPLIKEVIRSELGKRGLSEIEIRDIKSGRYENSNQIGYSAIVVLSRGTAPPVSQEVRGEFPVEQRKQ